MKFKNTYILAFAAIGLNFLLTSCEQVRSGLGLERTQPDEFFAEEHPPLSVPPSFDLKPPVAPKAGENPASHLTTQKAQNLVLKKAPLKGNPSKAEAQVLKKAAPEHPQPHIRETLHQEGKASASQENLAQKALFWQKPKAEGEVIDPVAEKERLSKTGKDSSPEMP